MLIPCHFFFFSFFFFSYSVCQTFSDCSAVGIVFIIVSLYGFLCLLLCFFCFFFVLHFSDHLWNLTCVWVHVCECVYVYVCVCACAHIVLLTKKELFWLRCCASLLYNGLCAPIRRNSNKIIIIIMYLYHVLINALSIHIIHINLNMIFCTLVGHSPIGNNLHKVLYGNTHMHAHMHTLQWIWMCVILISIIHHASHTHTTHTHTHTHTHTLWLWL